VQSYISKAKAKNIKPNEFVENLHAIGSTQELQTHASNIAQVYTKLQERLLKGNLLDFDDIITHALHLFQEHPHVVVDVRHVLVDEFQDTSHVQYNLIKHMSSSSNNITVVGDPDQSIYQWRAAESTNIKKLLADYPNHQVINLDMTYRSAPQIINLGQKLIEQDSERFKRPPLRTQNPATTEPRLCLFENEWHEALFITNEVQRIRYASADVLLPSDFAILCRSTAFIQTLEQQLMKKQIPYRIVGGKTVAERKEAKDLAAYAVLASDTQTDMDMLAFQRVANVPLRGLGDAAVDHVVSICQSKSIDPIQALAGIIKGRYPQGHGPWMVGFKKFFGTITELRNIVKVHPSVHHALQSILELTKYLSYLRGLKEQKEQIENRETNVQAVLEHAADFDADVLAGKYPDVGTDEDSVAPVSRFLQLSSLAPEAKKEEKIGVSKLTVATLHSSKGLEWPVVFIYGCEDGSIPDFRKASPEEFDEERRLLYVGMTRAEALLYLTASLQKRGESKDMSRFLKHIPPTICKRFHFSDDGLNMVNLEDKDLWTNMSDILNRKFPEDVPRKTLRQLPPGFDAPRLATQPSTGKGTTMDKFSSFSSFTSARTVMQVTTEKTAERNRKPLFDLSQTRPKSFSVACPSAQPQSQSNKTPAAKTSLAGKRQMYSPLLYLEDVEPVVKKRVVIEQPQTASKKTKKSNNKTPVNNSKLTSFFKKAL
jgi:DNA helicase-2/ATP-dependent DNA helicase PcrA